jgi:uncharacterized protein (TIGR02231 family)
MRAIRLALSGVLLFAPALAFAADVELQSKIDRVTVFPDAAVVTRLAPLDLAAGVSALILRGLPATLDPASIRVEGEGSGSFAIGGIDVRATPGEARPAIDAELERRLKTLRDERESVQARIGAAQGKKGTIERYAKASPEKLGPEAKPLDVAQWQAAWEAIGGGLAAVNEELRTLSARARDLEAEGDPLGLSHQMAGRARRRVRGETLSARIRSSNAPGGRAAEMRARAQAR